MNESNKEPIIIFTTGLCNGGAERVLFNLIKNDDLRSNYNVCVVSLSSKEYYSEIFEKLDNLSVTYLDLKNIWGVIRFFKLYISLRMLTKQQPSSFIVGWMYHGSLIATIFAVLLGIKNLFWSFRASLDGFNQYTNSTKLTIIFLRLLSKKPKCIWHNSTVGLQDHKAFGFKSTSEIFYNGFDQNRFQNNRLDTFTNNSFNNSKKFLFVGRVHPQKDLHGLIDCFLKLWDLGYKSTLTIITPATRTNLEASISFPALYAKYKRNIFMVGEVKDIENYYSNFDFLCLKSISREGFPNVVGEAMLSGCPVVTTDVGDCRFIVDDTGFVCETLDLDDYLKILIKMHYINPEKYKKLSCVATQRIKTEYSLEKFNYRFLELIKEYS